MVSRMKLNELQQRITPSDKAAGNRCRERWASLAKPLGGLGLLEKDIARMAELFGSEKIDISKRAVLVMCADNGVVAQGVTQTDSSVTALVAKNITLGAASISHMARIANAEVFAVDMGMKTHPNAKGLIDCSIADGTKDITCEPAMTLQQGEAAVLHGVELVEKLYQDGCRLIAVGEMGIGNTTTASAVAAVLLHRPAPEVTGRGAGLDDEGFKRKISAVERAIALHRRDASDPFEVLCDLGGFDIAAMAGAFIGGALYNVPIVADGFISTVSALVAVRMMPIVRKAVFVSHISSEPAATMVLDALGLAPLITAGMHIGEGTGAVAAIPLFDMALSVYNNMPTFGEIGMEAYKKT